MPHTRVFKYVLPEVSSFFLDLPIGSSIISVGWTPSDDLSTINVAWEAEVLDRRTGERRLESVHTATDDEARNYLTRQGFDVIRLTRTGAGPTSASVTLVPAIWAQVPIVSENDDTDGNEEPTPTHAVNFISVPTGKSVPSNYTFVGTLMRPTRSDASKMAVFHIFVEAVHVTVA